MAKKAAPKPAPKPTKPKTSATKPAGRIKWLDDKVQTPLINEYAQQMTSFLEAIADGLIEESELQKQEARVVALMKEIEPLLDDALHDKLTRLLCEVTVYDMMQTLKTLQKERLQSAFRG